MKLIVPFYSVKPTRSVGNFLLFVSGKANSVFCKSDKKVVGGASFLMTALAVFFVIFSLVLPQSVLAKISIVEVMYDAKGRTDVDHEWVKILNDDEADIEISKIKLSINDSGHILKDLSGSTTINKSETAVIVDDSIAFKINYPGYTGKLLDSSFSLTNTAGTVAIKDDKSVVIDSMAYGSSMGAAGDGNSLQKIDGVWKALTPTIFNQTVQDPDPGQDDDDHTGDNATTTATTTPDVTATTTPPTATTTVITKTITKYISVHSSSEDLSNANVSSGLEISAGRDRLAYVGTPIKFSDKVVAVGDVANASRKVTWSFGDGATIDGEAVEHVYKFAGDYNVVLNITAGNKTAVSRLIVRVLDPKVSLLEATAEYLSIKNSGETEINLNGWSVHAGSQNYVFPLDTIVAPKQILKVAVDYSKIAPAPGDKVVLHDPSQKERSVLALAKLPEVAKIAVLPTLNGTAVSVNFGQGTSTIVLPATNNVTIEEIIGSFVLAHRTELEAEVASLPPQSWPNSEYYTASAISAFGNNGQQSVGGNSQSKDRGLAVSTSSEGLVETALKPASNKGFWSKTLSLPASAWHGFVGLFYPGVNN